MLALAMNPFKWPMYVQTLFAMVLGVIAGLLLGPKAASIGVIAKFIIEIIKAIAIPLLFFAIVDAFLNAEFKGKGLFWMLTIFFVNGICAITIALTIGNVFKPGTYLALETVVQKSKGHVPDPSHGELMGAIYRVIPAERMGALFSGTTATIFIALIVGILLANVQKFISPACRPKFERLKGGVHQLLIILFRIIGWIVHLLPLAIFAAMAKMVGTQGSSLIKGLIAYFIACAAGMILHVLIAYQGWVKFVAKRSLKTFWTEAKEALIYSFGINSSLATLPITLNTLKRLKVSEGSARLSACVGTNLNNDGILLYEVVATLFMTQAYGWHLSLIEQVGVSAICVIATIGVAGIPEAGMISLSLVLSAIGLPLEALPILLTVDWFLGRMRSVTNVLGDLTGAISIDALQSHSPSQPVRE